MAWFVFVISLVLVLWPGNWDAINTMGLVAFLVSSYLILKLETGRDVQ